MQAARLEQLYIYGDIYDTLDACQELEMRLGRLRREHLITDQEWSQSSSAVKEIRSQLESHLQLAG